MNRYVVDVDVVLRLLAEGADFSTEHELLAPTLLRSQVLDELYRRFRDGELSETEAKARLGHFATMKLRYLGDKVLRRNAWEIAHQLGWDSTEKAEYIALTRLQADAFVTLDNKLKRAVGELVDTASIDAIL